MAATLELPKTRPAIAWGGAAFVLGNVLFIVNKLDEMSRLFLGRRIPDAISGENPFLILIGQLALITGYFAFYRQYALRMDKPGKTALRLFSGGGVLMAIGHVSFMTSLIERLPRSLRPIPEAFFVAVILGLLLLTGGLIWFGILNLRRPVLAFGRWLPLVTGILGFTGFFLLRGQEINATFLVFRTLFALGLIGLGLVLWQEKPALVGPVE